MTGGLVRPRRPWVPLVLLASMCLAASPAWGRAILSDTPPSITLQVSVPDSPSTRYGVDAVQQVVLSTDGGNTWSPVLSPGDPQAPDPSVPGACLPGSYDRVTFLAINPLLPHGLYVGTEGVLGDYLDNGCGNAPGGLFYSPTGQAPFTALNSGLPANADARGGGVAWGVQAISFDPSDPHVLYVQTDPSFLAVPEAGKPSYPTGPGVYRSQDGGTQWDAAYGGIAVSPCQFGPCRYPGSLAINPAQPAIMLLAAPTGLYRTANRGVEWQLVAPLQVNDRTHLLVRIDPYDPSLVYVVTDRAIYRSGDGGAHLGQVRPAAAPAPDQVIDLSFLRQRPPRVVYTLVNGHQDIREDSGSLATVAPASTAVPTIKPPTSTATATPSPSPTIPATATRVPTATARPTATASSTPVPRVHRTPVPHRPAPTATASPVPVPTASVPVVDQWPMVGHDAGQSFADPAGGVALSSVPKLRLRWAMAGAAPSIEANGVLYALTSAQKVLALDPATGAVRHRYLSLGVQGLAHDGRLVYFNRGTEIRYVDDRTADWKHTATDKQGSLVTAFGSMVVTGGILYTAIGGQTSGSLARSYAFDAATGKILWSHLGSLSSVPCLAGSNVYLNFGGFGVGDTDVLDARTGALVRVMHNLGTAQWHTSGDRLYASVLHGSANNLTASLRAYSLAGQPLWVGHDLLFGAALPDRVFGVTPTAIDARSARDGHRLWKRTIPGLHAIAPGAVALAGDLLLVQDQTGGITVLDSANGRVLTVLRPPTPAISAGNLIVGGGQIYESVTSRSGTGGGTSTELLAFGL